MGLLALAGALDAQIVEAQPLSGLQGRAALNESQVERGKLIYGQNCASCHGKNLSDGEFGPALTGPDFKMRWSDKSAEALLTYMRTKMPPSDPGALSSQSYADVGAYILRSNGMAANGSAPLPAAAPAGD
jgi:mono/diheme cytochrome c family protein